MASVIGNVMVRRVPCPGSDSTSMMPDRREMLVFTTSIPTPRPDISSATSLVETPGRKIRLKTSRRVSSPACCASTTPRSTAFCTRRLRSSSPAPSSSTVMTTWLPRCSAEMPMVPTSALPARTRASGRSMPWSMQLRMTCISGSDSSSTISLSSSVSAPEIIRRISFPASREILRTTRDSLSNTWPSGTIRTSRIPLCSSSSRRVNTRSSCCSARASLTCERSALSPS